MMPPNVTIILTPITARMVIFFIFTLDSNFSPPSLFCATFRASLLSCSLFGGSSARSVSSSVVFPRRSDSERFLSLRPVGVP